MKLGPKTFFTTVGLLIISVSSAVPLAYATTIYSNPSASGSAFCGGGSTENLGFISVLPGNAVTVFTFGSAGSQFGGGIASFAIFSDPSYSNLVQTGSLGGFNFGYPSGGVANYAVFVSGFLPSGYWQISLNSVCSPFVSTAGYNGLTIDQELSPPGTTSLGQFIADGTTPIAEGGVTTGTTVVFRTLIQTSSSTDPLQFQVEIQPSVNGFSGNPTAVASSSEGQSVTAKVSGLQDGSYHWAARVYDPVTHAATTWQAFSSSTTDFVIADALVPTSSTVLTDATTIYSAGNGFVGGCCPNTVMSPGPVFYHAPTPFTIQSIVVDDTDFSSNNHDGVGNIRASIYDLHGNLIARSMNTIYGESGCTGCGFTFSGEAVPQDFQLSLVVEDGIQGDGGFTVRNLRFFVAPFAPPPTQVLIIPGILGTKLSATSNVSWLTNSQLTSGFADDVAGDTQGIVQLFSQLEYNGDGAPITNLNTADLLNYIESPLPASELDCQSLPQFVQLLFTDCGPDLNTYNSLRDYLLANGFVPHPFPYDWRMDLTALSTQLYETVSRIMGQNPGAQVSLISHSMGGLIAGKMLARIATGELPPFQTKLGPIITLGTPFDGAVDAYLKLRGWEGLLPWIINGQASVAIGKNWTSAYELLPRSDFASVDLVRLSFASIYNGSSFASDLFPPLPRQSALPIADFFWDTNSVGQVSTFRIIGTGQRTPQAIVGYENTVINSGSTPALCKLQVVRGDGDSTVPVGSAINQRFLPTANIFYVQDTHLHLPSNTSVLSAIGNILSGQTVTLPTTPTGIQPEWRVLACSPVTLQITDAAANVTNLRIQQIPDSAAFSLGEATQVSVPGTGQFEVELVGTAVGSFDLIFNKTDSTGEILHQATFLVVPVLNGSRARVTLNESGPGFLTLDLQGNGATEFSISPGEQPNTVTSLLVLGALIQALNLPHGIEASLSAKLRNAVADLDRGNKQSAMGILNAFTNEVSAQSGKTLSPGDAASLVRIVNRLMNSI